MKNIDNKRWKQDKDLLEEAYAALYIEPDSNEECSCELKDAPEDAANEQTVDVIEEQATGEHDYDNDGVSGTEKDYMANRRNQYDESDHEEGNNFTEDHVTAAIEIAFAAANQLTGGDAQRAFEMVSSHVDQVSGSLNEALLGTDAGSPTPTGPEGEISWKAKREDLKDPDVTPGSRKGAPRDKFVNPHGEHGGSGKSVDVHYGK